MERVEYRMAGPKFERRWLQVAEGERYYPRQGQHGGRLASNLESTYLAQGYQTQMLPMEDGSLVVQIRKENTLKTITGTSESISVSIRPFADDLKVRVGEGKWIDKVGAGVAGWFLLWPLLFTAGYGLYKQSQLVNEVWAFIEAFLRTASEPPPYAAPMDAPGHAQPSSWQAPPPAESPAHPYPPPSAPRQAQPYPPPSPQPPPPQAQSYPPPAAPPQAPSKSGPPGRSSKQCPGCKTLIRMKAQFCPHCGHSFKNSCPSCGTAMEPQMRFCPSCGAKRA
jgi:RNA polymerase subunit RPABC4/transcription elongation factor Spt4